MYISQPRQTIYDAYDRLLFLAPLDNLHFSATIGFIYTHTFKIELEKHLKLLYISDL